MAEWALLGKLDRTLLEDEFGTLHTDEVILTAERMEHICQHHPEVKEVFSQYCRQVVRMPDWILRDERREGTVFLLKRLPESNLNFVIRLSLEQSYDPRHPMNSVMTCYQIREQNLKKLLNRNKILYSRE